MTKVCSKCGIDKSLENFSFKEKGIYRSYCQDCQYIKSREYYLKNKEQIIVKHKEYCDKNRNKVRSCCNKYYKKNQKKLVNNKREYRKNNKQKCSSSCKKWANSHREYLESYHQEYRNRNREKAIQDARQYYSEHSTELVEKNREYRKTHKEQYNKWKRQYRKNNPEKPFNDSLKRRAKQFEIADIGLTKEEYKEVLRKFDFRCFCCEQNIKLRIDHHYPLSKGFKMELSNAVLLCCSCNGRKHSKMPEDFYTQKQLEKLYSLGIKRR